MKLSQHIHVLLLIPTMYTIWLINAIYKNDLGLKNKLINELSKGPDLYIAFGFLALSLIYGIYSVKSHTFKKLNEGNGKNKIIRALKMGLQATIIAFFGRLGLWIAPFFFVTVIELLV